MAASLISLFTALLNANVGAFIVPLLIETLSCIRKDVTTPVLPSGMSTETATWLPSTVKFLLPCAASAVSGAMINRRNDIHNIFIHFNLQRSAAQGTMALSRFPAAASSIPKLSRQLLLLPCMVIAGMVSGMAMICVSLTIRSPSKVLASSTRNSSPRTLTPFIASSLH